jgi:hypothetical protein
MPCDTGGMAKNAKRPADPNQLAKLIVDQATGASTAEPELTEDERRAVARLLGRRGGLKGGPARRDALSAKRRREIAHKAAVTRWSKKR